jgi:hypothetical protein
MAATDALGAGAQLIKRVTRGIALPAANEQGTHQWQADFARNDDGAASGVVGARRLRRVLASQASARKIVARHQRQHGVQIVDAV